MCDHGDHGDLSCGICIIISDFKTLYKTSKLAVR